MKIQRLYEIRADQTPLLKIVAAANASHTVDNTVPADNEAIKDGLFDTSLALHRLATSCMLKQRNGLVDDSFELLLFPGWTTIFSDFKFQAGFGQSPAPSSSWSKTQAAGVLRRRFRRAAARPASPRPTSATEAGSGTTDAGT